MDRTQNNGGLPLIKMQRTLTLTLTDLEDGKVKIQIACQPNFIEGQPDSPAFAMGNAIMVFIAQTFNPSKT